MIFSSDSAINTKREDKLNRTPFSEHLGKAILEWTKFTTMVIGLYGEWGVGKSSIINLALEYIISKTKKDKTNDPIIFRFNPWNFTEQDQLVTVFLTELSKAIGYQGKSTEAKGVGKKLISYSKFFTPLTIIAPFIPQFAQYLKLPQEMLQKMGEASNEWAEFNEKDLQSNKKELDEQIKKLNRKIIIVIDDIDRLNKTEIRQIFQLVKMTADFPNTTYLLAFDDQKVEALLTEDKFSGREYLEKIIQVPFHVPTIEKARVERILFKELDSIIKPYLTRSSPFDQKRWQDTYYEGLRGLFSSLRRVNRFTNSLRFTITLIPDEINVIDFIGIESLRVFFPEVYKQIASNKALFVGEEFSLDRDDRTVKKEKVQKIIETVSEKDRKYVAHLIYQLFPQIHTNYGSEWQDTWESQKLVCSRFRFDRYFFLSVPEGQLPQRDIEKLINKSSKKEELEQELIKLIRSKKIRKFLVRIPDFKKLIPQKNIINFISTIFDISDMLPSGREHDFDFGATMDATRIAYQLLNNIQDDEIRKQYCLKVIQETTGIIAPIEFVSYEVERMNKREVSRLFKDDLFIEKMVKILCKKLEERVKLDKLQGVPSLNIVLNIWNKWYGKDNIDKFIALMLKNANDIGRILEGFSWQVRFGNPNDIKLWDINIDGLKEFTNIDLFKEKVEALTQKDIKGYTRQQKLALKLFKKKINQPVKTAETPLDEFVS